MEEKTPKTKKTHRTRLGRILSAVVVLLLVAAVVLAFLFREELSGGLSGLFNREDAYIQEGEAFSYEAGSDVVFALAGNGLAVASSTGAHLMDGEGHTILRQVFSMDTPAVAASEHQAAFFDVGGTALRVIDMDGTATNLDCASAIISVSMNASGWMAVCTEETGYKGMVTVYNASLEPVYYWYAGSGYVLKAVVSPGNDSLAVLCASEAGGSVHVFSLDSEAERAAYTAEGELLVDLAYLSGGRLCAVSENQAIFLSGDAQEVGAYDFGGLYLADYNLSGEFSVFYLVRYRTGNAGTLVTIDDTGAVLGTRETERDVSSISVQGSRLLVLYGDTMALYDRNLGETGTWSDTLGVREALLRPAGDALLLHSYTAETYSLG